MKKRQILLSLLAVLFLFFIPIDKQVKIKGSIDFVEPVQKLYISYTNEEGTVSDTAELKNSKFKFEIKANEPVLAYMTARLKPMEGQTRYRYQKIPIFLEPGTIKITIKDSLKFAIISGSKAHDAFIELNKLQSPFDIRNQELRRKSIELSQEKKEDELRKITEEMEKLDEEKREKAYHVYLENNITSPIALYVLKLYAGYDIDAKLIEPYFEKLAVSAKRSQSGVFFKDQIETAKKTGVGVYAMNFSQPDTLGNVVSLSSFKGKYVLLDFWASWCGPCRAENPGLVKSFKNYKDKNFTVLSVSLDRPDKKQAWLDAIHKDGLTWTHVSDLNFWDNAVAKQYGIRAIPQNLLLDPTGKIIAKNLHGDELDKKLKSVL